MIDHDDVKLSPEREKALQKEIRQEVIKQNNRLINNYTLSDNKEENIGVLEKMTNLSREKIKTIAYTLRKKYIKQQIKKMKRKKPASINIKKQLKRFLPVIVIFIVVLVIGKYFHGEITTDMLVKAVSKGDYDRVKSLLAWGAEINWKGNSGRTPLMEAARLGYIKIIYLLLEKNVNVRVRDSNDYSAIEWAVNDEVRAILGRAYAESCPPDSPIQKLWDMEIAYSYNNFIMSVKNNNPEVVTLFLDAGMKPVKKKSNGSSALDIALKEGHNNLFQLLLSKVRRKNTDEIYYTFFYAVITNQVEIVNILIEWGINVKKCIKSVYNPLYFVQTKTMLNLLLQYSAAADIEGRNSSGQTLLMKIALDDTINDKERIDMVVLLLDYGADPMVSNAGGSLVKQARQKQRNEIADLLLKAGAGE